MKIELIATATFGLESVVKREIEKLGYRILKTEDGKVTYLSDERGIVRSNLWLRAADRVLLKMGEFKATTFEELYQQVKGIPFEEWIPPDGKFTVSGTSVKSALHHVPSCQSITKKAIVDRLSSVYGIKEFAETGDEHGVKVTILKDRVTLTMDTSGKGLHKRGYRVKEVEAPIKETLAASLVQLSFWNKDRILLDPFTGSGTIPIEAAMIGINMAPGLLRDFVSEGWNTIDKNLWEEERKKAREEILNIKLKIGGSDLDEEAVKKAVENAGKAGVDHLIEFSMKDIKGLRTTEKNGVIVTNPPYGERIGDKKEIEYIYKALSEFMKENPSWSLFIISSDKELESKVMGRPADRRRKLYNGRIETTFYQFHGIRE